MIERREWQEFREAGLLWWTNRILHIFGWAIVCEVNGNDCPIIDVYPARVKFRGFTGKDEGDGFVALTQYLKDCSEELVEETKL
jgi:ABC-type microcin C transport system permease subunit YejE